jgi:hypothetical protein
MAELSIPDFGELLAPQIGSVPEDAVPAFLARLERSAAQRYRDWALQLPGHAQGLLQCARREDDIATRIDGLYPATRADQLAAIEAAIGPAVDSYYRVFSNLTTIQQLAVQANAERQGAAAWRAMLDDAADSSAREVLEQCARTEEASADFLDALLNELDPDKTLRGA